jgi:hypothetical protein
LPGRCWKLFYSSLSFIHIQASKFVCLFSFATRLDSSVVQFNLRRNPAFLLN